jgi:curved DNA-binding protein CbpA
MDKIVINGETFNPYFMLDVVPDDNESFITKAFRKKAKMWHPDKIKSKNPEEINKAQFHFKVLVESYEYIINKKRSVNHSKKREHIEVANTTNLKPKTIDNSNELEFFNQEFDNMNIKNPNDYGYETDPRIKDTKEYDNFNYKPYQLFNSKQFNRDDFNKAFEYQQQSHGNNMEVGLYHTTTDGFNAYNGGDLNGLANVSSYNGVMIVGDTYGQSGIGYYDTNFSDYKKSFEAAKNPNNNIEIPENFEASTSKTIKPLSKQESQRQIELQMQHRQIDSMLPENKGKHNFRLQEQMLLDKQELELKQKIENDKNMILQFQDMYGDKSLIQAALDNRLVTSADYVSEDNMTRRFKRTDI